MRLGQRKTAEADSDPDRLRARRQGESRSVRLSLMSWETLIGLICLMGLSVLIGPEYEAKVEAPTREVTLHGHQSLVGEVAFAADGQTLLSCAYDGTVRLWEARRASPDFGAEVGCLPHDSHVYAAAMSPDRKRLSGNIFL